MSGTTDAFGQQPTFIRYAIAFKLPVGISDVRRFQVKGKQAWTRPVSNLCQGWTWLSNADMPASLAGALVPVYAAAENHEDAARKGVAKLVSQSFEFLDIQGPIDQLDAARWSDYVSKASCPGRIRGLKGSSFYARWTSTRLPRQHGCCWSTCRRW